MNEGGGQTASTPSGWTIDTLAAHHSALREADLRFENERDRRYAEVATEREKALKIKETADLAALGLAREIQTYKDEKANELRSQIERERGSYATKDDLGAAVSKIDVTIKPIADYVITQQGGPKALTSNTLATVLVSVALLGGLYFGLRGRSTPAAPTPTTITQTVLAPTPTTAP